MRLPLLILSLLLATITGGPAMATEEPPFAVEMRSGNCEIRQYPQLVAAEVVVEGSAAEATNSGFRMLAGYIFGGNTRRQSIAMTAPVIQAPSRGQSIAMTAPVLQVANGNAWTIRFVMPREHSLASLPIPNDQRVHLKTLPPARYAVIRFSGLTGTRAVEQRTRELRAFLVAHNLAASGPPQLARYDPPWTPWFMRRNEVLIPL